MPNKKGIQISKVSNTNLKDLKKIGDIELDDSIKDIEAANSAGIDAFLLDTNYNSHLKFNNRIKNLISLI